MKRSHVFLTMLFLLATLAACRAGGAPASATAPSAAPGSSPGALADIPYINLGFDVPYVTIPPVNPGEAKEIRISLPPDMEQPRVVAMPDGGALALGMLTNGNDGSGPSKPVAARYDARGNILWKKVYKELKEGYIGSLELIGENGFVYVLFVPEEYNTVHHIIFCGIDGPIQYQQSNSQSMIYQYIMYDDTGAIVVGDAPYQDGALVTDMTQAGEEMLSILTQSEASTALFSRALGVKGYFSPMGAFWNDRTGLIVLALKKGSSSGNQYDILSFDTAKLQQKWVFSREAQGNQYIGGILAVNGGVLANGADSGKPFILKLDSNGKKLWEIEPDSNGDYSVISMVAFKDGCFAAVLNRYKEGDSMRGVYLALYDATGHETKKIKLPNEEIREIQPLDGGGLITVGIQNIKTLPQPAYVSSIWYDTETVVTRYDEKLNIMWRKVYDKYKGSIKLDITVPTADGNVIVER